MKLHKMKKVLTMILTLGLAVCTCATTAYASTAADETCTVNYQSQSDGVTITNDAYVNEKKERVLVINIQIDAGTSGDKVIDLSAAIENAQNTYAQKIKKYPYYVAMPGDSFQIQINITNASEHTYKYMDNSFVLSTADAKQFTQSTILGYDGQLIPNLFIGTIDYNNTAIKDLLGSDLSVDDAFSILDKLPIKESGEKMTLSEYILDKTQKSSLSELNADYFCRGWNNGIFTVTRERLLSLVKKHPEMSSYLYITSAEENNNSIYSLTDVDNMEAGKTVNVELQWPDEELAAMSYNRFYQDYWSYAFGEDASGLNPCSSPTFTRDHGIGDYITNTELYDSVNTYLTGLTTSGLTNEESSGIHIAAATGIDTALNSGYQCYPLASYCALTLEQTDKEVPDEPSVPKDPTPVYPIIPSDPTPIEPTPVDPAPVDPTDPTPTEPTTPITDDPTPTTPTPDEPDTDVSDDKTPTTDVSDNKTPSSSAPKTGDNAELPGEILLLGFSVIGLTVILKNSKRK